MNKKSKSNLTEELFFSELDRLVIEKTLDERYQKIVKGFYQNYKKATAHSSNSKDYLQVFYTFAQLIEKQQKHPYVFANYHQKIRKPFDYYQFGIDFMRLLVDLDASKVTGLEELEKMQRQLANGENVILLGNHQTESDPQLTSILLENTFPKLAENIIFVAGERVITDPLAIPFSLGCDLLCIYSKKYIDLFPDLKRERLLHNQKTMKTMSDLLKEGGKIIYVAPSGGRDRRNKDGKVEVAKFDAASIEMFYLMAKKAKTPTHFYPYTLVTYEVLPPPETTQKELGEKRETNYSPIYADFGKELDMQHFPGCDIKNKLQNREKRAEFIWSLVKEKYNSLTK